MKRRDRDSWRVREWRSSLGACGDMGSGRAERERDHMERVDVGSEQPQL